MLIRFVMALLIAVVTCVAASGLRPGVRALPSAAAPQLRDVTALARPCFIGARDCLSLDPRPVRPCLAADDARCERSFRIGPARPNPR
jgi:hypothetical protein